MAEKREKIEALLEHHLEHDEVYPRVDFYIKEVSNEKRIISYGDERGSYGSFNILDFKDHLRYTELEEYVERDDNAQSSSAKGGLTEQLSPSEITQELDQLLQLAGWSIEDIDFAVEAKCPDESSVTWNDVSPDPSDRITEKPVSNPEEKIQALYEYFQEVLDATRGVPVPLPEAAFYVDGEKLPHSASPNFHLFTTDSDEQEEAFIELSKEEYGFSTDAPPLNAGTRNWSPELGYEFTEQVFQEILNYSLDEVTHVRIIYGADTYDWTDL